MRPEVTDGAQIRFLEALNRIFQAIRFMGEPSRDLSHP